MMRTINMLVIHCADTPNGSRKFTVRDIDAWHAARGFRRMPEHLGFSPTLPYIGYHAVIDCDGVLWPGRGDNEVGQHTSGYNATSLSVCLLGQDKFTRQQWRTLQEHVEDVQRRYHTVDSPLKIAGHREFSNKTCPGFDVRTWLALGMRPLEEYTL